MVFSLMRRAERCAQKAQLSQKRSRLQNFLRRAGALPARKQPDQFLHLGGGIDELAAPALSARAVCERQGPAMPHFEGHAHAAFSRALDLPALDQRAWRRDEIGAADE